ncbi:MAG: GNAT family N-acetyltransferase [Actinomycetota bacterium]|nr:GNAT family N-acetyltransferase [Actinomycetota bacterium]
MKLTLRDATAADAPLLGAMNRQLADDERSRNPLPAAALAARMEKWLGEGWRGVLVESEAQQVIGYALFQISADYYDPSIPEVYVRQFFIARDFRRQGLGRKAFALVASTHFPAGANVLLDVLATNPAGQQFWHSLGFEPYSTSMRRPQSSQP